MNKTTFTNIDNVKAIACISTMLDNANIPNSGVKRYGLSNEYGIYCFDEKKPATRFSIWFKDNGKTVFNVGVKSPICAHFLHGSLVNSVTEKTNYRYKSQERFITCDNATALLVVKYMCDYYKSHNNADNADTKDIESVESIAM